MNKVCNDCKWFLTQDSGYSNYTVCETVAYCLKNKNPHLPSAESYSWLEGVNSPQLKIAEHCKFYTKDINKQIHIDVEDMVVEENDSFYIVDSENYYKYGVKYGRKIPSDMKKDFKHWYKKYY